MRKNRFVVRCFDHEGRVGELLLSDDNSHFQKLLPLPQPPEGIDGFYSGGIEAPDFIVSIKRVSIDGQIAPDWSQEPIVGLQGRVYRGLHLGRSEVLSLLFVRRLRVFDRSNSVVISTWYRVPWAEWVLPADPSQPWGNDFREYLHFRIERWRALCESHSGS